MIIIKSQDEIELMGEAGAATAQILADLEQVIQPGISTKDVDDMITILRSCIAENEI